MDCPKLPTLEKKDNQSLIVLIDNSKDSINERFGLQLTSGKSQKLNCLTEMQVIINIQNFTRIHPLRKAKFLLAT